MNLIGQMSIPKLLCDLIESGAWQKVSDEAIHAAIPFLDPTLNIDLNGSLDSIIACGNNTIESAYKGSESLGMYYPREHDMPIELPLLDMERCYFIGYGRQIGDDTWLALYYENVSDSEPSVVINRWANADCPYFDWGKVTQTFRDFARRLELI